MARNDRRQGYLGGAGLLAMTAYLCVKSLKKVEERLKRENEKRKR